MSRLFALKILILCSGVKAFSVLQGKCKNRHLSTLDMIFGLGPKPSQLRRARSRQPKEVIQKYFDLWNNRDIESASELFADSCIFEDTLYNGPFEGKTALRCHLLNVAASVPDSFKVIVDEIAEDMSSGKVGVRWHVEADEKVLPFTRGASMYQVDTSTGLIVKGFDVPEPVLKSGSLNLAILKQTRAFDSEPRRVIPLLAWLFYCWYLFFSDIAPGVNVLHISYSTLKEVLDLSLNFWLILPIFFPSYAAEAHPVMDGLFNLVLAWSGLFAGFMLDGKRIGQRNEFLPSIIGMQFVTNAVYLPYLVSRKPFAASERALQMEPLSLVETACESRLLPSLFGLVGIVSVCWAALGRMDEYDNLAQRFDSFLSIASNDRLVWAFVVDAIYYMIFQGWLINDDAERRNLEESSSLLKFAKYVPFFGLVFYLIFRPVFKGEAHRQ